MCSSKSLAVNVDAFVFIQDEGRRGPMNSHTSADSGFDEHTEISMSPHGKHVKFHVEGPIESSDFTEDNGRNIPVSGCVSAGMLKEFV